MDAARGSLRPADGAGVVPVDHVDVAWERWDSPAGYEVPPVVLVHGTAAHGAWWHHTVPWLDDRYRVIAVDLSGHGESGRRESYSLGAWSREVAAVTEEVAGGAALLVGHSIGGLVAAGAAGLRPDLATALVLVDTMIRDPVNGDGPPNVRRNAVFDSLEQAVGRYRLMPEQPVHADSTLDYIAARSVRPVEGGWSWKVDAGIFDALRVEGLTAPLHDVGCPTVVVRGELSPLVPSDVGRRLSELLGVEVPQYDVPGAHHHVMVDRGARFGALLRQVLDGFAP